MRYASLFPERTRALLLAGCTLDFATSSRIASKSYLGATSRGSPYRAKICWPPALRRITLTPVPVQPAVVVVIDPPLEPVVTEAGNTKFTACSR